MEKSKAIEITGENQLLQRDASVHRIFHNHATPGTEAFPLSCGCEVVHKLYKEKDAFVSGTHFAHLNRRQIGPDGRNVLQCCNSELLARQLKRGQMSGAHQEINARKHGIYQPGLFTFSCLLFNPSHPITS